MANANVEVQMNGKLKVKVIKKVNKVNAEQTTVQKDRTRREAAREMVSNVSNWVNDLQSRKGVEAKLAFESLFKPLPNPTNS
jgi:hypothetical protein